MWVWTAKCLQCPQSINSVTFFEWERFQANLSRITAQQTPSPLWARRQWWNLWIQKISHVSPAQIPSTGISPHLLLLHTTSKTKNIYVLTVHPWPTWPKNRPNYPRISFFTFLASGNQSSRSSKGDRGSLGAIGGTFIPPPLPPPLSHCPFITLSPLGLELTFLGIKNKFRNPHYNSDHDRFLKKTDMSIISLSLSNCLHNHVKS